jgi:hypothetical protein
MVGTSEMYLAERLTRRCQEIVYVFEQLQLNTQTLKPTSKTGLLTTTTLKTWLSRVTSWQAISQKCKSTMIKLVSEPRLNTSKTNLFVSSSINTNLNVMSSEVAHALTKMKRGSSATLITSHPLVEV